MDIHLYNNLVIDEENQTVTFPLWNLSGQFIGYQQYNPEKPKNGKEHKKTELRYYTYVSEGQYAVWGLETVNVHTHTIFVVEGIFDACKIHNAGYSAIATLTSDVKFLRPWLKAMGKRIITICDNDENGAGSKLAMLPGRSIQLICFKDLGEMSCDQVSNLLKYFM